MLLFWTEFRRPRDAARHTEHGDHRTPQIPVHAPPHRFAPRSDSVAYTSPPSRLVTTKGSSIPTSLSVQHHYRRTAPPKARSTGHEFDCPERDKASAVADDTCGTDCG